MSGSRFQPPLSKGGGGGGSGRSNFFVWLHTLKRLLPEGGEKHYRWGGPTVFNARILGFTKENRNANVLLKKKNEPLNRFILGRVDGFRGYIYCCIENITYFFLRKTCLISIL